MFRTSGPVGPLFLWRTIGSSAESGHPPFMLPFALVTLALATSPTLNALTDCGALPNDNVDDTKALQGCIDQLTEGGGGTLFFPIGRYLISNQGRSIALRLRSNVTLLGEGPASVVKLVRGDDGFSETRMVVTTDNPTKNVRVMAMTFDGGRGDKTCAETKHRPNATKKRGKGEQQHALFLAAVEGAVVDDVRFQKLSGDAIYIYGRSKDVRIEREFIRGYCRAGVVINAGDVEPPPTNVVIRASRFVQDPTYKGTEHARAIDVESVGDRVLIEDNFFDELQGGGLRRSIIRNNVVYGEGIALVGCDRVVVENNWVYGKAGGGKRALLSALRSKSITFRNNVVFAFGQARAGLDISNDSAFPGTDFLVEDNVLLRGDHAPGDGAGIYLYGIDSGALVRGNLVRGEWRKGVYLGGGKDVRLEANDLEADTGLAIVGVRPGFPLGLRGKIVARGNTLRARTDAVTGACFPADENGLVSCDGDVRIESNHLLGATRQTLGGLLRAPKTTSEREKRDLEDGEKTPVPKEEAKREKKRRRRRR